MKEVEKIGYVNPESEHQSGLVVGRGGYCHQSIQCNGKTRQRQYARLVVLGGIGRNERENRDSMRVMDRKASMYALKSHIDKEQPMVTRVWIRKS